MIEFNSVPVKTCYATGGTTVSGVIATGGVPYDFPVKTSDGASGCRFSSTVSIPVPCDYMFCKIII